MTQKFSILPEMVYCPRDKTLIVNDSHVRIIPLGLRGVNTVELREKPIAVAPDFKGKVVYRMGSIPISLNDKEITEAKRSYLENSHLYELPYPQPRSFEGYSNLAKNMHFVTVEGQAFLDLRQSNVSRPVVTTFLYGVKKVLLPTKIAKNTSYYPHSIGKGIVTYKQID